MEVRLRIRKPPTEEQRIKKNIRSRERYLQNKEKILAYHAELYKKKKEDLWYLEKMAEEAREYRKKHPEKTKEMNVKRRAKDPEAERNRCKEWFSKHKRKRAIYQQNRAAKLKTLGVLSTGIFDKLKNLQKNKCAICRIDLSEVKPHLDHIIPISLGGLNVDSNIQLLCSTCNNQKYNKHPIDFMQEKGMLL